MVKKFNNNRTLYQEFKQKDFQPDDKNFILHEYPDYYVDGSSKKIKSKNLGIKFAAINSFFFDYLKEYNIPSAFHQNKTKRSLEFINHERFPFIVKILNIIDKRTAKIFGKKAGENFPQPVFELHYGKDKNSFISESHLFSFNLCTKDELNFIIRLCSKINAVLKSYFERRNMQLAELNCCFGKAENKIYLVDDFTPKSLKVFPLKEDKKWSDPYKLTTPSQIRKYTDQIHNLMSA